ncbi:MAG: hypothetical protein JWO45_34 [Spartobacteria bacterium]|nr:hypothetical protein [Spartobacteria bacterium]
MTPGEPFRALLTFHGDLGFFLRGGVERRQLTRVVRILKEPTSIKDVIEACGVPHSEVNCILVDRTPVNFTYVLRNNSSITVYPMMFTNNDQGHAPLQQRGFDRFVADCHLGKLASNLRLLGFDIVYDNQADDPRLLKIMERDERALLTRDRRLLMHAVVRDGYCPRSDDPTQQTIEVIRRFALSNRANPFSRCLQCNAPLIDIDKASIIDQLQPLTRLYYDQFRRCTGCGKIYWRGSHFSKLEKFLNQLRSDSEIRSR